MRKLPLVEVEWEDTTSKSGWEDTKDADLEFATIHNVGWQLQRTKKYILLVTQRDSTYGGCADRTKIPRGCIKSIRRIE